MHDLNPQDHSQQRKHPLHAKLPLEREFGISQGTERDPGHFAGCEEETDFSTLDDDALATEAKREALRDHRQERQVRADEAAQRRTQAALDNRQQVALIGLLIFAAAVSMVATASGLANGNAEIVRDGLFALCAVCGGTIYQLSLRGRPTNPRKPSGDGGH